MIKKLHPSSALSSAKWFRLAYAIALALAFSLTLLFLPIAWGTSASGLVLSPDEPLLLSLPLGVEAVHAAGGLTVTKVAHASAVDQGGLLTYTLIVTNQTGLDLSSETIIISDTVPANTTCVNSFNSADGNWLTQPTLCQGAQRTAFWVKPQQVAGLFTFPNNAVATMTYVVSLTQPLPDQSFITNLASSYIISAATLFDTGANTVNTFVNAPLWQIGKVADPSPVVEPGGTLTYTLTVTNIGHLQTSGSYTITDQLPANTNFVSASTPGVFSSGNVSWVLNTDLNVGESITVSYVVTITEPLTDAVAIVNQTYSITGGNVFSQAFGTPVIVTVSAPVTMTLTKTDNPDLVVDAGDLITYTLTLTNEPSSKGPADNVVISDTLPANTTLVDAGFVGPATGVTSTLGSDIIWSFTTPDPLLIGETASVFMVVRVTSPLTNSTIITNDTYTADASNDIVTILGQPLVTTTVQSTPTLEISKIGLPAQVQAGGELTYTIRYTNSGNANATNVIINDIFPISTTFDREDSNPLLIGSAVPNDRTWNVGFLAGEGGSGIITLTLDVQSPQNPGTVLTNVISITSSEVAVPTLFTATNTISSTPSLHITKIADPSPVAVGSILTYTIIYSNDGNADANGVTITDALDSRVIFNGASDGGTFSSGEVTWNGLSVPTDGLDRTLSMSVTVASTLPNNSILTNKVAIILADLVATRSITTLVQAPSLAVTKIVSPTGIVRAGDTIEYTITYTNTGAITITTPGILITDTFPVSVTNIVSGSTRATFIGSTPPEFIWFDTDLPPDNSGIITLTGQVITSPWASTGGQVSNTVIVAGNGYSATSTVNNEGRPGLPFTITVTAIPSTTQVGTIVPVNVQAEDIFGNPVFDSTPITLTTSLVGSTLDGVATPVIVPTAGGQATANLASTIAGTTTVIGQVAGASTSLTDTAVVTFTPGPVVAFILQATTPQTAGVTFPITITAVDSFGNRVNTLNQAITISDTTGTIAPTAVTLVNGITVTNFTVFSATSPALDRITAISGSITGTRDIEIRPNVPTTLTLAINPTSIRLCQTANVTTSLTDNFGNAIANKQVNLVIFPGATTDFSPNPGNTNSAGIFTSIFTGRTPASPGTVQASILSPSLITTTAINVITPALATNLSLSVTPNPLPTGGNLATVTATVTDCFGLSAGQVVTFTVSNPALAALPANPTTATSNASGVATTTLTSNSIPQDGTVIITATTGTLTQTVAVVLQSPLLTITKTANPISGTEVRPGQTVNYTLYVTNTGTGAASNVVITDVLPLGVSFVSCTSTSGSICSGGATTTVTTPTLGAGRAFTTNIQVTVGAVASGTVLSNLANARSTQTSLITSNIVAHPVTTATINVFLPIIMKNSVTLPDLVGSFSLSPANPTAGQPVVVTVVITNIGTGATDDGFWVDFYINPVPVPTVGNQRWDKLGSTLSPKRGIAWVIASPGLVPGASITLTSNGVGGLAPSPKQTSWPGSFAAGTQDLYIYADSFSSNGSPNGGILESNETNNRSELHLLNPLEGGGPLNLSDLPDAASLPPRWDP